MPSDKRTAAFHERYGMDENLQQTEIPSIIVPVDYLSNIKEETLLFFSDKLRPGMVVLVEPPKYRDWNESKIDKLQPNERIAALHTMRWCRIEEIETFTAPRILSRSSQPRVRLLVCYADGSQTTREYDHRVGWYVKNASIPKD